MLRLENGRTIGAFIFEDILCRWGAVEEIISNNGPAFIQALDYLSKQYGINHIRISPYNSRANGIVERRHYDVRESLVKSAEEESKWSLSAHSVFWAERSTISKLTGYSPYYLAHGVEPLFPFDIVEATYLVGPADSPISTAELIATRARQLQMRPDDLDHMIKVVTQARIRSIQCFEQKYFRKIVDYDFEPGSLVLVRNTRVEKELNRKTKPRYIGPMVVIRLNLGGAYILAEMDGLLSILRYAAFRLIP